MGKTAVRNVAWMSENNVRSNQLVYAPRATIKLHRVAASMSPNGGYTFGMASRAMPDRNNYTLRKDNVRSELVKNDGALVRIRTGCSG